MNIYITTLLLGILVFFSGCLGEPTASDFEPYLIKNSEGNYTLEISNTIGAEDEDFFIFLQLEEESMTQKPYGEIFLFPEYDSTDITSSSPRLNQFLIYELDHPYENESLESPSYDFFFNGSILFPTYNFQGRTSSDPNVKFPYFELELDGSNELSFPLQELKTKLFSVGAENYIYMGTLYVIPVDASYSHLTQTFSVSYNTSANIFDITEESNLSSEKFGLNLSLNKFDLSSSIKVNLTRNPSNSIGKEYFLIEDPQSSWNYTYQKDSISTTKTLDLGSTYYLASQVRPFSSLTQFEEYIDNSLSTIEKFNLTQKIVYNQTTNKSIIEYTLSPENTISVSDLVVYQQFEKEELATIENLSLVKSNFSYFVVDKDPVIGWYIEDIAQEESIEFEVDGNSSGGTFLITQEPVLFNGKNLIVNYRSECNSSLDEINLFELDYLENSSLYTPSSSKQYQVCLSSNNENMTLNQLDTTVFSYKNGGNFSFDTTAFLNTLTLGGDSITGENIYFDIKVQKESPNQSLYSCLGSFDTTNHFGDCAYNSESRMWLFLGEDKFPPASYTTILTTGNTMLLKLSSQDNLGGSGINYINYSLDDKTTWNQEFSSSVDVRLSCPTDSDCLRKIYYSSVDIEGNVEPLQEEEFSLLNKGSSCQPDCTAKPSPDRFVKECNLINGCEFASLQIAQACDSTTMGTYVEFNATHEIKCPMGPIREMSFTSDRVDVSGTDGCENLVKIPYATVYEGESVIMNVLVCDE